MLVGQFHGVLLDDICVIQSGPFFWVGHICRLDRMSRLGSPTPKGRFRFRQGRRSGWHGTVDDHFLLQTGDFTLPC